MAGGLPMDFHVGARALEEPREALGLLRRYDRVDAAVGEAVEGGHHARGESGTSGTIARKRMPPLSTPGRSSIVADAMLAPFEKPMAMTREGSKR